MRMDEFSGMYNFLILQQIHRGNFTKKWEDFERWSTKSTGEEAATYGEGSAAIPSCWA